MSCEDVVEIDLEESAPRLVVEASLVWDINKTENPQSIQLTTTTPYFEEGISPAEGATVSLLDPQGKDIPFEEVQSGVFRNDGFLPEPEVTYELEIIYNEEVYRATANLTPTPVLENVEQNANGGFGGDEIELKAFYSDPAGIDNYYLFRFFDEELSLQLYNDEFTDGNQTFALYSDDDLEPGDEVIFEIEGISRGFYQYMYILLSQSGSRGGPFQTQPTTVRGNIINTTDPENFPFGYFRMSAKDILHYEVQ